MGNMKRLNEELENLADLYEYGHLQLSADPAGFLEDVISEIKELRKENHELMLRLDSFDDECHEIIEKYPAGEKVFVHLNDDAGLILASIEPYSCPGDWINSFTFIGKAESYIKEKGYKYDRSKDFYCTLSPDKRTTYERFVGKIPESQKFHPLETE